MFKMEKNQTIYEAFKYGSNIAPDAPALLYMGRKILHKTAAKCVDELKNALINAGLKRGGVVVTCLPNIPEAAYLIYAVSGAGGIVYPVHALSSAEQIDLMLKNTRSEFFFVLSSFADAYVSVCRDNGTRLISCSPAGQLGAFKKAAYNLMNKPPKSLETYERFIKENNAGKGTDTPSENRLLTPSDTAVLLNSGGTGGVPKVVELSNLALNDLCANGPEILGTDKVMNQYMLSALPYFHGFGLAMGLHAMFCHGGCNVLIPKFRRKYAMQYILKKKITYMIGVPALYGAVMSHKKFKGKLLKNIKVAFVGGDFVPQTLIDSYNGRMQSGGSDGRMYEGYGLTETVTVACVNTDASNRRGTVGRPLEGIEVRAFDTYNPADPLPSGTTGELFIRGGTLMNGYYKDEEATANTFFADKNGARWLKTGDFGSVDADGFVVFKQRLKRIIKVSGVSVFPAEIEQAAIKIDGISQVCAFGTPDKKKGSAVVLAVETAQKDTDKLRADISALLSKELSVDAFPQEIIFMDKFPMTKMNKIDYPALQKHYTWVYLRIK